MSVIRDPRVHSWPGVSRRGKKIVLSTKVLPTWRLETLTKFLFDPLVGIWKLLVLVAVVDFGLAMLSEGDSPILTPVFRKLLGKDDYAHSGLYAILLLLRLVWFYETRSGRNLTRILFGRRLRVVKSETELKAGGWVPEIRVELDHTLSFAIQPLDKAENEIQKEGQQLMLVIDDSRSVKLTSIHGMARARKVVENANMLLQLGPAGGSPADLDLDPSRA
ncbi:hypothetical protein HAHE_25010 [Haloferula helveola]|uniref:Uncharacterized protein n=1 Tax=Haloferula helveola TaxID=490095 RepID=A0ABM7RN30_9BACT|nr:hypothetical protein HAHE_25010 [Haloferula helveola]